MNFELILVVITAVAGVLVFVDKLVWAPKRSGRSLEQSQPIVIEYARSLFPVFLVVLILRSFVIEPFRIPSGSMYPTLQIGDFIAVNKFAYGVKLPVTQTKIINIDQPERGDVVVFKYPNNPNIDYIKRVVGLPGDQIEYKNRQLIINGQKVKLDEVGRYVGKESGNVMTGASVLRESFDNGSSHEILHDLDKVPINMGPVTVPKGHYFMVGDNRDHSNDSRFWGFVPEENLKGRAFAIWMNWDNSVQFDRIGQGIE